MKAKSESPMSLNISGYYSQKYNNEGIKSIVLPEVNNTFFLGSKIEKIFCHLIKRSSSGKNPENVILQGPQGCGKTETAMQFAAHCGLPVLKINCSLIREARDWFGHKTAKDASVHWVVSEFAKLVERGGVVILLDEITRATPPVLNSLLPLLDDTGFTFLEEVKQTIRRGPDVFFFATANIGNQFSGTYGKLDKALDDRFAIRIKTNYLEPKEEVELLISRTGIDRSSAKKMVNIAAKVRGNYSGKFGGKLSSSISTRNLLDLSVLYQSIGVDAFDFTIIPLFSSSGGTSSQEAEVRQIIQSQFG